MLATSEVVVLTVAASAGAAAAIDIRTRRIPNVLTFATAGMGITLAATGASGVALTSSIVGIVLGLLLMLPGYTLGATGGGDMKLLGAMGAVVGVGRIGMAFLFTAIAGGLIALALAASNGRLGATLQRVGRMFTAPASAKREIEALDRGNSFPYGPAIAVGSTLAALL